MKRRFLLVLLAGGLALCFAGYAQAGPSYLGLDVSYYLGGEAVVVATGDLNGDGRSDVAIAGNGPDGISRFLSTFLGTENGELVPGPTTSLMQGATSLVIDDVIGDSAPDLVYSTEWPYQFQVRAGVGTGAFGPESGIPTMRATYVQTADLDGDLRADILVATENGLVLMRGSSATTPTVERTLSYPVDRGIATGDLDGDGDLDLVLAPRGFSNLSVLQNGGGFNFSLKSSFADDPNTNWHREIALADLAGNGMPSLVLTDPGSNSTIQSKVRVAPRTGTFTFGPSVAYASAGRPYALAIGDWNLDGRDDVAVAHQGIGEISLFAGRSDGGLDVRHDIATVREPRTVASADLDGDGMVDLVTGSAVGGMGRVSILPGNGNGSFGTAPVAVPSRPRRAVVADANADGLPDIVLARASGAVSILPGDGTGALGAAQSIDVGTMASAVVAGDLDGDGLADLATANTSNSTVSVFRASGPGIFSSPIVYPVGIYPIEIALRELTGDGFPELVTLNEGNSVSILPGLPGGVFAPRLDIPFNVYTGGGPRGLVFGDVDEDGLEDMAIANRGGSVVVIHPRAGGTFEVEFLGNVGDQPIGVALIDADEDGHLDLAVSSETEALIRIFRGTGGGAFAPAVAYPAPGLPGELSACDWNGDGHSDLACLDQGPAYGSGAVLLLAGDGSGHFTLGLATGVEEQPYALVRGDLDLDGRPDFVVTSEVANAANILINRNAGPIIGVAPVRRAPGVAFASVAPSPARRSSAVRVEYTLPAAGSVRLKLVSISGRIEWSRDLGLRSAGPGAASFDFGGLVPGVYFLRLEHPAGAAAKRIVVLP